MARLKVTLIFFVFLLPMIPHGSSAIAPSLTFEKEHGYFITNSTVNLSGFSNIEMKKASWKLWDVSNPSLTTLVKSGDHMTTVSPLSDNFWQWNLQFEVQNLNCTCYLIISVPDGIDVIQSNILLYIGEKYHRPEIMLPHSLESSFTSQNRILLSKFDAIVTLKAFVPSGMLSDANLVANICESPYWVCLQERIQLPLNFTTNGNDLSISLNSDTLNLDDGIWDFELILIDELLVYSAPIHLQIHIDTQLPQIELEFDTNQKENYQFSVFANIDDGYTGSSEVLTWMLRTPSGDTRALSSNEIIDENRLELNLSVPGSYTIEVLVRDSAGHFNRSNRTFVVEDVEPIAEIYFDTMKLASGITLEAKFGGDWVIRTQPIGSLDPMTVSWSIIFPNGEVKIYSEELMNSSAFTTEGTYILTLRVSDDEGGSSSSSFQLNIVQSSSDSSSKTVDTMFAVILFLSIVFVFLVVYNLNVKKKGKSPTELPKWSVDDESKKHS
ncbi:MAG: hypothetical protein O2866_01640 [archaeon]|nr:hypothetical protein [archaeon]MDA1167565.1 hypothetical protein [archaeon]